jgi:hypothetical protein
VLYARLVLRTGPPRGLRIEVGRLGLALRRLLPAHGRRDEEQVGNQRGSLRVRTSPAR